MATKKISDLARVTSVQDTDLLLVETSNGTRSISKVNIIPTVPTALSQLTGDSTHRLVTDTEKSTWNNKADGGHSHDGGSINPFSIEFKPSTSANNGGYLDFHWNGNTSDYTSRIIENASGSLYLEAVVGVKNPAAGSSYVRNIHAGTSDLTAGSSSLATGAIYIVYE